MTLYWYMHWFWITGMFYVSSDTATSTLHSIPDELLRIMKEEPNSTKLANDSPPNHPASVPTKYKFSKKHPTLLLTNIKNSTIVGDASVIKDNVSNLNSSEQQKYLFSGILNAYNHSTFNDSLTYFEEEHSNKSVISNIEQIASNSSQQILDNLSAAGITGITLGCVSIVGIILALSYILYRNRSFNRPQVLNDHCSNLDSSGYIDDTSDNSEEMYSLDNDSFLNSLEAMTIQNYWTDTVKHTKL